MLRERRRVNVGGAPSVTAAPARERAGDVVEQWGCGDLVQAQRQLAAPVRVGVDGARQIRLLDGAGEILELDGHKPRRRSREKDMRCDESVRRKLARRRLLA